MTPRTSPVLLTGVAGLVAALTTTGAYAWLSGPARGAGSARTGSARAVTLSPGTVDAGLFPGTSAPVTLRVANPNPGPVRIAVLSLDVGQGAAGFAADAAHAGCSFSGVTLSDEDNAGSGWTVPGSGSTAITLPGALSADETLASSCQGAVLTVYLKAS